MGNDRLGLTFSSNALEGNSLTESETKVVIEDDGVIRDNGGVNNKNKSTGGGVNLLENELLTTINTTPGLNAPALAISLNKSLRTIQRYLKSLSDTNKIEFKGAAKNGGYFLKP